MPHYLSYLSLCSHPTETVMSSKHHPQSPPPFQVIHSYFRQGTKMPREATMEIHARQIHLPKINLAWPHIKYSAV